MEGNLKTRFSFRTKDDIFHSSGQKVLFRSLLFARGLGALLSMEISMHKNGFFSIQLNRRQVGNWMDFFSTNSLGTGTQVHCTNCKRNNYLEVCALLLLPPSDRVEDLFVFGIDGRVVVELVRMFVRCRGGNEGLLVVNGDV